MKYYVGGVHAVKMMLDRFPNHIECLFSLHALPRAIEDKLQIIKPRRFEVKRVDKAYFERCLPNVSAQGLGLVCNQLPTWGLDNLFKQLADRPKPLVLMLDKIQDPQNLGAIIRSAAAFGVDAIVSTRHQAVGLTPTVLKVACGAACFVPLVMVSNLSQAIRRFKAEKFWIYATSEHADESVSQADVSVPVVWLMGSEGKGVSQGLIKQSDACYNISVEESFPCLNVSVSTAICLYETARLRKQMS